MSLFKERGISVLLSLEKRLLPFLKKPGVRILLVAFLTLGSVFLQRSPVHAQSTPDATDGVILFIADVAISLAGVIGTIIVALLEVVTIPIMQYNGFVSSPVVGAGWSIVRDTVNMFFVAVLLFIAVATIFGASVGGKEISWRQSVPRLMVFAIVINFSRTLCGLMIDAAQVVMLTFANALKDIAGGNFIQVFGLRDLISISTSSDRMQAVASGSAEALTSFDYFTAGIMSVFLMLIVLIVVLMLTAILVYRIVALWILIVIAPLTWFLGGAKGVISSDAYAEWWKNFKCYLLVGPVLTFFVWLTLAVAGAGNIANNAGFTSAAVLSSTDANTVGGALKIFEVSRLTSYIIGIALMFAGFDAAQKMCAGVKSAGFINNRISQGRDYSSKVVGSPGVAAGALAGGAAYVGAKGLGAAGSGARWAGRNISTVFSNSVQGTKADILTQEGRARRARAAAKATNSPFFASVAGRYAESVEKARTENVKGALEGSGLDKAGKDTQVEYLAAIAKNGKPMDVDQRNRAMALYGEMIGDAKKRKALEKREVNAKNPDGSVRKTNALAELYSVFGADLENAFKGDKHLSHNLHEFAESRPDIATSRDGRHGWADGAQKGSGDAHDYISAISNMEEVRKLDKAALADERVRTRLKQLVSGTVDEKGKDITAYDFIANGRLGSDKQDALKLPKNVQEFLSGEGFNINQSSFTSPESRKRFEGIVQKDTEQILKIPERTFRQNGHNNDVVRAVGSALNQPAISRVLEQYAAAENADARTKYSNMLERIDKALEVSEATAIDPNKFKALRRKMADTKARIDGRTGRGTTPATGGAPTRTPAPTTAAAGSPTGATAPATIQSQIDTKETELRTARNELTNVSYAMAALDQDDPDNADQLRDLNQQNADLVQQIQDRERELLNLRNRLTRP